MTSATAFKNVLFGHVELGSVIEGATASKVEDQEEADDPNCFHFEIDDISKFLLLNKYH